MVDTILHVHREAQLKALSMQRIAELFGFWEKRRVPGEAIPSVTCGIGLRFAFMDARYYLHESTVCVRPAVRQCFR